jgi:hypothetical protein
VNTNINYNIAAEAAAELYGTRPSAAYLGKELAKLQDRRLGALAAASFGRRHRDKNRKKIVERPIPNNNRWRTKYICVEAAPGVLGLVGSGISVARSTEDANERTRRGRSSRTSIARRACGLLSTDSIYSPASSKRFSWRALKLSVKRST